MSKRVINIGNAPNDGTGDPLRTGLSKVNENFTELYNTLGDGNNVISYASTAGISTLAENLTGTPSIEISGLTNTGVSTVQSIQATDLIVAGIVTATQFSGDGSQLTGVTGTGQGIDVYEDDVRRGIAKQLNFAENIQVSSPDGQGRVNISVASSIIGAGGTGGGGIAGIEVRDDNVTLGDVTKLDFSTNLDLTPVSEGISTVSISFPTRAYSGITTADITNWDRAYGWGDHSVVGYLTSYTETQTLDDVVGRGHSTSRDVSIGGSIFADKIYYSNVWSTLTDIYNQAPAILYHGMFAHVHETGHGYFAHQGDWIQLLDTSSKLTDLSDTLNDVPDSGWDGNILRYNFATGRWEREEPISLGIGTADINNWNAAYNWGNHATVGYITSYTETQTIDDVLGLGNSTTKGINLGVLTATSFIGDGSGITGITTLNISNIGNYATISYVDTQIGIKTFSGVYNDLSGKPTIPSGINDLSDVNAPTPSSGQVLKWSGEEWQAAADIGGSGGSGIGYSDLSVTQNPVGVASLSYNQITGVFLYTPPDLTGYATTTSIVGLASEGYVDNAVVGMATTGYVNNAIIGFVTDGYVNSRGFTTTGYVTNYVDTQIGIKTFSGSYVDLRDKPTIPADTGDLTNNAGFVTSGIVAGLASEGYVDNATAGFVTVEGATFTGIVTMSGGIDLDLNTVSTPRVDAGDLILGGNQSNRITTQSGNLRLDAFTNEVEITADLSQTGNQNIAGIITASLFSGDGSGLTGVAATDVALSIQDEGSIVGTAKTLNFAGAGITASISANVATITVSDQTYTGTASTITTSDISNWNTSYGWGNHATVGYLTTGGGTFTGIITAQGGIDLGELDQIRFNGPNLAIYGGADLKIDAAGGKDIVLTSNSSGGNTGNIQLRTVEGGRIDVTGTGGVGIYHTDTSLKLQTISAGATVTGNLYATRFYGDGSQLTNVSNYTNSDVDTHLNTGTASNNEFLSWNGSDYDWVAISTNSYQNSDVDTHLNTSSASTGEVLSWNGSDYDWVAQSGGGNVAGIDTTGVSEFNHIKASGIVTATRFESTTAGTPSIDSPNNLDINAVTVSISTDLSVGNRLSVGIITAPSGNISIAHTTVFEKFAYFGAGENLRLHNDGSNSIVEDVGSGSLVVGTNGPAVRITKGNNSENMAIFNIDGSSELYHDGLKKFETTSLGSKVTGNIESTGIATAVTYHTNDTLGDGSDVGFAIKYSVTANGASSYRFSGPGLVNSTDNPTFYLQRGFSYIFVNTTGSGHPFRIQFTGTTTGVGTYVSGSQSGTQIFTVPFDAPSSYEYQCTLHGGMKGTFNVA
jgi:plastocyanin